MNARNIMVAGAWLGGLSVVFGAFGAHKLKVLLSEPMLNTFKTGVEYQFYHAIALLFMGIYLHSNPNKKVVWAAYLMMAGILLFSGSLYVLAQKDLLNYERWMVKAIGPVTPLGGLCFIAGWLMLGLGIKSGKTA